MGRGGLRAPVWTRPDDVLSRLRRRWETGEYLAALANAAPWQPVTIPVRAPTAAELAEHFGAAQDWVDLWQRANLEHVRLEWRPVGGRLIGSNKVPVRVVLDTPRQLWALLRVGGQVTTYRRLLDTTRAVTPALVSWLAAHPMRALRQADQWSRLLDTVRWIDRNARPEIYLRQVDVPGVDTKFIEQHRTVLAELLDCQLDPDRIDRSHPPSRFAQRYGFRDKPTYIRLRTLNGLPPTSGPFRELAVRVEELATTPVKATRIIVVENEISYLALPPAEDAVALLGGGYALSGMAPLQWLRDRDLAYWGDIDTHGFAILDRLRQHFPHTRSLLMDRETLLSHRDHWGREPSPTRTELANLRSDEAKLYADLLADRYAPALRLEQERIRFGAVERALSRSAALESAAGSLPGTP